MSEEYIKITMPEGHTKVIAKVDNQIDKYPAHEKLARNASFLAPTTLPGGFVGIINEYIALLQRQQSDEGLIRELVDAAKEGRSFIYTECQSIDPDDTMVLTSYKNKLAKYKAAIQKANERLKERE